MSYHQVTERAANLSDNLCRWDGRRAGHFEVWFLTLNHLSDRRGFWLRYTIESPQPAARRRNKNTAPPEARAALWAAVFDPSSPEQSYGLKKEFEAADFVAPGDADCIVRIGEASLASSRATGAVENDRHSINWDLSFSPDGKTHHHVPPGLKLLVRPSAFVCSPNLDVRFSGRIIADGREFILEDEPGCQSHIWGRKQVDEWVWVHSNSFEAHEGTVFEGLVARQRRMGLLLPPLQSLFLRHRGQEHRFIRLRLAEQWRRNLGIGVWAFSAMNTHLYIEGTAQCRLRDMLQAQYRDPDGEPLYCINSEVASLKIRIFRRVHGVRWRHIETIKSRSTAHLEYACRAPDPAVPIAF
ncbi:MAG TPA: tocopherol cyclase family protein [Blastocatellia bacterium]|nr:tocopherol cyclase family protein [Blastocatellia bacterium]